MNERSINITTKFVHSLPMYSEYQKKRMQNLSNEKWDNSFKLTECQIHNWFDKQKEDLSEAILTKLKNTDPFVFENIMIKLMSKMGYKGADEKVFVTQKSNDGVLMIS